MATQYEGNDQFPASFEIPDDDDKLDAASVNVAFEALADRTAHLRETLQIAGIDRDEFIKVARIPLLAKFESFVLIENSIPTEISTFELSLGELHSGDIVLYETVIRAGVVGSQNGFVGVGRDNWQTIIEATGALPHSDGTDVHPHTVIMGKYVEQSLTPVTRKLVVLAWHENAGSGGKVSVQPAGYLRATIYRSNEQPL